MTDVFESSPLLLEIWGDINTQCFGGSLHPPASIGWVDLSDHPGLGEPFGMYLASHGSIGISHRFKHLEAKNAELKALCSTLGVTADEKLAAVEKAKEIYEIAYRLVLHEVVHQATHQAGGSASTHGAAFIQQAQRAASALGVPAPTQENADHWPDILTLIAKDRELFNGRA
jgi:hypothetical protein